ncbi:RNA polymerase sigma factor [Nannocystaceae bacterium ST9]
MAIETHNTEIKFNALYSEREFVRRRVRRDIRGSTADDVEQDVWLAVTTELRRNPCLSIRNPKGWLSTIIRRTVSKQWKKLSRPAPEFHEVHGTSPDELRRFEAGEAFWSFFAKFVKSSDALDRWSACVLRYHGLTQQEVASTMGATPCQVRTHLEVIRRLAAKYRKYMSLVLLVFPSTQTGCIRRPARPWRTLRGLARRWGADAAQFATVAMLGVVPLILPAVHPHATSVHASSGVVKLMSVRSESIDFSLAGSKCCTQPKADPMSEATTRVESSTPSPPDRRGRRRKAEVRVELTPDRLDPPGSSEQIAAIQIQGFLRAPQSAYCTGTYVVVESVGEQIERLDAAVTMIEECDLNRAHALLGPVDESLAITFGAVEAAYIEAHSRCTVDDGGER